MKWIFAYMFFLIFALTIVGAVMCFIVGIPWASLAFVLMLPMQIFMIYQSIKDE